MTIRIYALTHDRKGDLVHDKCKVYMAREGSTMLGLCHVVVRFTPVVPDFVWLTDLSVAEHARRRGVGTMIVKRIFADYHPMPIRGNVAYSHDAFSFWHSMGAKADLYGNFVIERHD